eukprot:1147182-Pelagomonas_calceolata.AAC.3
MIKEDVSRPGRLQEFALVLCSSWLHCSLCRTHHEECVLAWSTHLPETRNKTLATCYQQVLWFAHGALLPGPNRGTLEVRSRSNQPTNHAVHKRSTYLPGTRSGALEDRSHSEPPTGHVEGKHQKTGRAPARTKAREQDPMAAPVEKEEDASVFVRARMDVDVFKED